MVLLVALFIFCICKRRKRNRRRKGKHTHSFIAVGCSEIPTGPSLLESAKKGMGRVGTRASGWLCYVLRLISEGQFSGVTSKDP